MTNVELTGIENRVSHSRDGKALVDEVRLAWRELDKAAQGKVDADRQVQALRSALWQVREMTSDKVAREIAGRALAPEPVHA
jgi:hypothetical protein